ncbi:ABC transporter substrate-binding protein [Erysipelothrix urinaevulpis]|uniref:ABC transporter substrate-binding protein n=1 Tax=Erysipelothrix urinaevulpis TaxID=2683717 RepID=UPI00135812C9|nr:ABC transporter substrate-binding protein [Erysipelothrix urinaevulpis]
MKHIKKITITLLVVLLLTACGTKNADNKGEANNDGKDLPVLRVAMMPFITSLPTEYIIENGLDVKNGFKIESTMFSTGAPMNEAVAADLWDVGAMGAAAVTGVANYDMMIIGEVLESLDGLGIFTKPAHPAAKVKGLNPSFPNVYGDKESVKGSTILLPIGTAQHFTTLKWLEKIGLKQEDVNIVNMETVQAYQALKADQADMAALNVPTFFDAVNDDMVQLGNLADLGTRYVDMIVANPKAVEGKQELIQKYVNLVMEANAEINKDKEKAADLMMEFLKKNGVEQSRESVVGDLERANFIEKDAWKDRDLGLFAKELGEFYIAQGQIDASLTEKFETSIDSQFVK